MQITVLMFSFVLSRIKLVSSIIIIPLFSLLSAPSSLLASIRVRTLGEMLPPTQLLFFLSNTWFAGIKPKLFTRLVNQFRMFLLQWFRSSASSAKEFSRLRVFKQGWVVGRCKYRQMFSFFWNEEEKRCDFVTMSAGWTWWTSPISHRLVEGTLPNIVSIVQTGHRFYLAVERGDIRTM